jgi:hypothetical protein
LRAPAANATRAYLHQKGNYKEAPQIQLLTLIAGGRGI